MDSDTLTIRPAWRLGDGEIELAARAFWRRLNILPAGVRPEDRVKELCSVAFLNGEVAGLSTTVIEPVPFLRSRLAMLRVAVDPAHRRRLIAVELTRHTGDHLEQWSLDHPAEDVKGLAAILQSSAFQAHQKSPVWPRSGLVLVGYTTDGQQFRVRWFNHAVVE
jgi:hypothetical protein